MAGLNEQAKWETEIYRIEENDPVHGGEDGVTNKPIKQLANRTKYLKVELEKRYIAYDATTTQKGIVQLDSSTNSNAEDKAATSKAVKTVNDNANERVSKSGDTMTGSLTIDNAAGYVLGRVGQTNKWLVGKRQRDSDEVSLLNLQTQTSIRLIRDRVVANKDLFVNNSKVFHQGFYPQASETDFGLTKLSHKTNGTDKEKAASEYALGEVRKLANQAKTAAGNISLDWDSIASKPRTYPPSSHTHGIRDITGLQIALNRKADSSHTHSYGISDITGLQTALNRKADSSHRHQVGDISGLDSLFEYRKVGNFEIRKYPDGTMIQTYVIKQYDLYEWRKKSFVWAVRFVGTPLIFTKITVSKRYSSDEDVTIHTESDGTTCWYSEYEHGAADQGDVRICFLAIGSWKVQ